ALLDPDRFIEPGAKGAAKIIADHPGSWEVRMIAFDGKLGDANLTLHIRVIDQIDMSGRGGGERRQRVVRLRAGRLPIAKGLVRQLHRTIRINITGKDEGGLIRPSV